MWVPLLATSFALIQGAQAPVTLDTFKLADKQVQATLPTGDAWKEVKTLYDSRAATPVAEWRTKIVIFTYSDILDHGKDGILRERRTGFFGPDKAAALNEIALFGSMLEAYSGGKLKFVPEVQLEEQAMRFDSPAQVPFDANFAKSYFTPRLNAGGYDPDDHIYRGPYNSVFFLHDALSDTHSFTSAFGMPISGLPFYYDYDKDNPGQLARRLFNEWLRQVSFTAKRHGFLVGSDFSSTPDRFSTVDLLTTTKLPDNNWTSLADMKDTNDYGANHKTAILQNDNVFLEPSTAPIKQPPHTVLNIGKANLETSGYFSAKAAEDPQQGTVALIEENWIVRNGWVRILGDDNRVMGLNDRFLDILLKNGAASHTIEVVGENHIRTYELFNPDGIPIPVPAEMASPSTALNLKNDGTWQHLIIDLKGIQTLRGVYITAGNDRFWPVDLNAEPSIYIASVSLEQTATPTPTLTDPRPVGNEALSAKAAAITADNYSQHKQEILALLANPAAEVQINAANVFSRVKDKAAEAPLAELSKSIDPRVAEAAMHALKFQGTDAARGALLNCLTEGPFEANRYFAALTLAESKDPTLAEPFSLLIDSKNRETKLAAIKALSKIPGEKAEKFLLAFMLDNDPQVEAEVETLENRAFEDFQKRMEWYSINDASDWVRALAFEALLESKNPDHQAQGFKGISDDSSAVRINVLQYLQENPVEQARSAIVAALADPNEEVRAQALKTMAALQNPANLEELSRVGMDTDPRVQFALENLVLKQKLKLPQPIMELLHKSVDPEVAALSERL